MSLVDPANRPLARLLPEPQGLLLGAALEDIGVELHLAKTPRSILRRGHAYLVQMSDGQTLAVDCVIAATGLEPLGACAEVDGRWHHAMPLMQAARALAAMLTGGR